MTERNNPCHCGSGKKYRKCCGQKQLLDKPIPDAQTLLENLRKSFDAEFFNEAEAICKLILKEYPQYSADAFHVLGRISLKRGNPVEAERLIRQAISINPKAAQYHLSLGIALQEQAYFISAAEEYHKSMELDPESPKSYHNFAIAIVNLGFVDGAIDMFRTAIQLRPNFSDAHWGLSLALLTKGLFSEGWKEYEWRIHGGILHRPFPQPSWDGSPLEGKTIIIHCEQGIGDHIMFASMIDEVARQSGLCIVECDPRLVPLFKRSFPCIEAIPVVERPEAFDNLNGRSIDVKIAMGSLPGLLRKDLASFPRKTAFLIPDSIAVRKWKDRFQKLGSGLKVGISWKGGKNEQERRSRSAPFWQWDVILNVKDVQFVNLQYGDSSLELEDAKKRLGVTIHHWEDSDPLKDIDDFGAQVSALDLMISIDNSTVHLSGAFGVPTWVILPIGSSWRWLTAVEDSPWYSSVRLFRQKEYPDWGSVFESVAMELGRAVQSGMVITESDQVRDSYRRMIVQEQQTNAPSDVQLSDAEMEEIEACKYRKAWGTEKREYASYSPGLDHSGSNNFLDFFQENGVKTILDAGIGSGKLSKKMLDLGFDCHGLDIADNCLDPDMAYLKDKILTVGPLWDVSLFESGSFDAVVCTDVMEHIQESYINRIIGNFSIWTKKYVFLQIALLPDNFGQLIGESLHLTVKPKGWWDERLRMFRFIRDYAIKNSAGEDICAVYLLEKK